MIKHERARHLGIAVGEQAEQLPLPPPGAQHGGKAATSTQQSSVSSTRPAATDTSRRYGSGPDARGPSAPPRSTLDATASAAPATPAC